VFPNFNGTTNSPELILFIFAQHFQMLYECGNRLKIAIPSIRFNQISAMVITLRQ
jgi:hypothetical protein